MELKDHVTIEIPAGLLEAVRSFPVQREVEHCGVRMTVSPFDVYAQCGQCGARMKVRSFSATGEIEDVFDAVFQWMMQPKAQEAAQRRQQALAEEADG